MLPLTYSVPCQHSPTFRDIRAKFGIPNSPQSSDIGQNSDGGVFDFPISGQSLIKENCYNSTTSNEIDMELGPVTKRDSKNMTTSKKFDDGAMSEKCDVIVFFSIYGQFGVIQNPDCRGMVCEAYIFINSNLLSYKN